MQNPNYQAVLFDLDGTLLDTIDDITDLMNSVLAQFGFGPHTPEDYKKYIGDGIHNSLLRALPEGSSEELLDKILDRAIREFATWQPVKTKPYDGISELLDELSSRKLKMAVLSNRPEVSTIILVQHLLSKWKFDCVMGASQKFPLKPDPAGALEASRRLGVPPKNFLYLGDSNTDMKTAVSVGMYPVGVLWGFRPREELVESGAKALLERPRDLIEMLG